MGLWLLQESLRTWELTGTPGSLPALLVAAAERPAGGPVVDPDDPAFLPPGDMPARIAAACGGAASRAPVAPTGRRALHPRQPGRRVRGARSATPRGCPGRAVDVVHLVGGGARN